MHTLLYMKNSSRIVLPALFLLIASFASYGQVRIGPEAGMSFGMQRSKTQLDSGFDYRSSTLKPGALVGVNVDIKILKKCYLQTGLFYTFNDVKFKDQIDFSQEGFGIQKKEINDGIHYFRLPLYVMYKSGYDGCGRFLAGIGPYIGYAFLANRSVLNPTPINDSTGKMVSFTNVKTNYQLELGNSKTGDQLRNWDYGVNACIGYESNVGLFFRGSFNWGFQNLLPDHSSGDNLKNWGVGISIGYNIGKDNW
jgi:hypothetical protein